LASNDRRFPNKTPQVVAQAIPSLNGIPDLVSRSGYNEMALLGGVGRTFAIPMNVNLKEEAPPPESATLFLPDPAMKPRLRMSQARVCERSI